MNQSLVFVFIERQYHIYRDKNLTKCYKGFIRAILDVHQGPIGLSLIGVSAMQKCIVVKQELPFVFLQSTGNYYKHYLHCKFDHSSMYFMFFLQRAVTDCFGLNIRHRVPTYIVRIVPHVPQHVRCNCQCTTGGREIRKQHVISSL